VGMILTSEPLDYDSFFLSSTASQLNTARKKGTHNEIHHRFVFKLGWDRNAMGHCTLYLIAETVDQLDG
jgi:hypothetical protein